MSVFNLISAIKNLQTSDRKRVEKAYYTLFKDAAPTRYASIVNAKKGFEFDSMEQASLQRLFIEIDGKWRLNATPEFFEYIGEEMPMVIQ